MNTPLIYGQLFNDSHALALDIQQYGSFDERVEKLIENVERAFLQGREAREFLGESVGKLFMATYKWPSAPSIDRIRRLHFTHLDSCKESAHCQKLDVIFSTIECLIASFRSREIELEKAQKLLSDMLVKIPSLSDSQHILKVFQMLVYAPIELLAFSRETWSVASLFTLADIIPPSEEVHLVFQKLFQWAEKRLASSNLSPKDKGMTTLTLSKYILKYAKCETTVNPWMICAYFLRSTEEKYVPLISQSMEELSQSPELLIALRQLIPFGFQEFENQIRYWSFVQEAVPELIKFRFKNQEWHVYYKLHGKIPLSLLLNRDGSTQQLLSSKALKFLKECCEQPCRPWGDIEAGQVTIGTYQLSALYQLIDLLGLPGRLQALNTKKRLISIAYRGEVKEYSKTAPSIKILQKGDIVLYYAQLLSYSDQLDKENRTIIVSILRREINLKNPQLHYGIPICQILRSMTSDGEEQKTLRRLQVRLLNEGQTQCSVKMPPSILAALREVGDEAMEAYVLRDELTVERLWVFLSSTTLLKTGIVDYLVRSWDQVKAPPQLNEAFHAHLRIYLEKNSDCPSQLFGRIVGFIGFRTPFTTLRLLSAMDGEENLAHLRRLTNQINRLPLETLLELRAGKPKHFLFLTCEETGELFVASKRVIDQCDPIADFIGSTTNIRLYIALKILHYNLAEIEWITLIRIADMYGKPLTSIVDQHISKQLYDSNKDVLSAVAEVPGQFPKIERCLRHLHTETEDAISIAKIGNRRLLEQEIIKVLAKQPLETERLKKLGQHLSYVDFPIDPQLLPYFPNAKHIVLLPDSLSSLIALPPRVYSLRYRISKGDIKKTEAVLPPQLREISFEKWWLDSAIPIQQLLTSTSSNVDTLILLGTPPAPELCQRWIDVWEKNPKIQVLTHPFRSRLLVPAKWSVSWKKSEAIGKPSLSPVSLESYHNISSKDHGFLNSMIPGFINEASILLNRDQYLSFNLPFHHLYLKGYKALLSQLLFGCRHIKEMQFILSPELRFYDYMKADLQPLINAHRDVTFSFVCCSKKQMEALKGLPRTQLWLYDREKQCYDRPKRSRSISNIIPALKRLRGESHV